MLMTGKECAILLLGHPLKFFFFKMFSIILIIIECVVYVCTDKHVPWHVGGGVEDSMVELTHSKHLWDLAVGLRLPGLPSKHFCVSPTSGGLSPLA